MDRRMDLNRLIHTPGRTHNRIRSHWEVEGEWREGSIRDSVRDPEQGVEFWNQKGSLRVRTMIPPVLFVSTSGGAGVSTSLLKRETSQATTPRNKGNRLDSKPFKTHGSITTHPHASSCLYMKTSQMI